MLNPEIDITEWMAAEIERLNRFLRMWETENANDPENWPDKLPAGEWDEQLRAFEESRHED
jgi:hypothetical protein